MYNYNPYSSFQTMNSIAGLIFFLVFALFIFVIGKGIIEWLHNENSPRLSVHAIIIAKRVRIDHDHIHHHNNPTDISMGMHVTTTTSEYYYITFEFNDKDRVEFRVDSKVYGVLIENDKGILTYQGTRFLDFRRTID